MKTIHFHCDSQGCGSHEKIAADGAIRPPGWILVKRNNQPYGEWEVCSQKCASDMIAREGNVHVITFQ